MNKNGIDIIKKNELIRGQDDMNLVERRLANFVLSKLTPQGGNEILFTTKEISDGLGFNDVDWSYVSRIIDKTNSKMVYFKDGKTKEDVKEVIITGIRHINGVYKIFLNERLIPYLLDFKDKMKETTMFRSSLLQQFKFKHTQRLYEILKSWLGWCIKSKKQKKINIEELKFQLNVIDMTTKNFISQVINPAIEEINNISDIYIEYEKDISTKKIIYLNFSILDNTNYKHEKVKSIPSNTDTQNNIIIQTFAKHNKKPTFEQIQQLDIILEKDFNNNTEDMVTDINKFFANDKVRHKHISTYIKFEKKYEVKKDSEQEQKIPEHLLNDSPVAEYVNSEDKEIYKNLEEIF